MASLAAPEGGIMVSSAGGTIMTAGGGGSSTMMPTTTADGAILPAGLLANEDGVISGIV